MTSPDDRPALATRSGSAGARRATPADAPELARLRAVMMSSMHGGPLDEGPWRREAEVVFAATLADPADMMAGWVVDGPDGTLVASALGDLTMHVPGPRGTERVSAHVFNVVTDPTRRGEGLARACLTPLLAWFAERGARRVTLNATEAGTPLYRSLGFETVEFQAMGLTLPPRDRDEPQTD